MLGGQKISAVQRGYDLTPGHQFLRSSQLRSSSAVRIRSQRVEAALKDSNCSLKSMFEFIGTPFSNQHAAWIDRIRWWPQRSKIEMKRARPPEPRRRRVADGTRTRNSQNHNLELYH